MESKQKTGEGKRGEINCEFTDRIGDEQYIEEIFANELKNMNIGPMISALIKEEPDMSTKVAILNMVAQNTVKMVKRANTICKKRKIRFGPAAVVMAAKE